VKGKWKGRKVKVGELRQVVGREGERQRGGQKRTETEEKGRGTEGKRGKH
jgi:hypothetical protein